MPRLLLVRHAQSQNNVSGARVRERFRGDPERILIESELDREPDPELSELGRAQTRRLAESLAPQLAAERSLLIVSPMRRALQTAAPVAAQAGLGPGRFCCEAELYEVGGCYHGEAAHPSLGAAQIEAEFAVRCRGVAADGWYAGRAGRETPAEADARVERVITWAERTLDSGEHDLVVVVSHGDFASRLLRRWLGVDTRQRMAFIHGNTGITRASWVRGQGLLIEAVNDQSHLPVELRSGAEPEGWWRYAMTGVG